MLGNFLNDGVGFLRPGQQSFVAELTADGGLGRVSVSELGFNDDNFIEMPDGGLWLSGGFIDHRTAGRVVVWGAWMPAL